MIADPDPFPDLPRNAEGHLALHARAALFRLLAEVRRSGGAEALDAAFARYPALAAQFDASRSRMPAEIGWDAVGAWWDAALVAWERGCVGHLPLRAAAEAGGLALPSRVALVTVGLVEESPEVAAVVAELQGNPSPRRPAVALLGRALGVSEAGGGAWTVVRPLVASGLVEVLNEGAPRSEWTLRVPALLWDAIRGEPGAQPAPWVRLERGEQLASLDRLVLGADAARRVAAAAALLREGRSRVLVLRSVLGGDAVRVAGAIARSLGRGLAVLGGAELGEAARRVGPLCTLADAVPVIEHDLAPGETASVPAFPGYRGPVIVSLGDQGGVACGEGDAPVVLALPAAGAAERRRHWCDALGEPRIEELSRVVDGLHVGGGVIRRLAPRALGQAALAGRSRVSLADVREAAGGLNRQLLDELATRVPARGSWSDLVVPGATRERLLDLHRRCRHREAVGERLGATFGEDAHRGVRALFTGPSGTGKTLAARILAAVLGMDLYRVDLASVVNRYVGETEKNLHKVLTRAEALDVVLLLDEGDSLLGRRTSEVRSANDRYANLETNYLLQRLEPGSYRGIVVVTTNQPDAIDPAFQRRMDVVIPFHPPQPEERLAILRLHLPERNAVTAPFLERTAVRCALSGSQLRNAALAATLLALDDGVPMSDRQLEAAVRGEYLKVGGICPLDDGRPPPSAAAMGSFVTAFARS